MRKALIVLAFEYKNFVKSASFIIMLVIFMLVGIIGPTIPTINSMRGGSGGLLEALLGGEGDTLALVDNPYNITAEMTAEFLSFTVVHVPSIDAAYQQMADGHASYAVEIHDDGYTLHVPAMKLAVYNIQAQLDSMMRHLHRTQALIAHGIDEQTARDILNHSPQGEIVTVSLSDTAEDYQENMVYAYVMIFLLYFGMMSCGQYVLITVVREKSTKTMELLITACKSGHLIHGKVLGVVLASLTKLVLMTGVGIIFMAINAMLLIDTEDISAVAVRPDIIIFLIVFSLLGIFSYAYLYAGLASTVSRMEDAGNISGFPVLLTVASFIAAMAALASPGATWVTVLSYVPYFTPMVMFTRLCLGTAAMWEVMLGVGVQFAAIIAMGWLSARIYRMGMLMYGNKINMRDMLASIKN
jgi:ABC-2 type transport system permease protein